MAHGTFYVSLHVSEIVEDGTAPRGALRVRAELTVERAAEIVGPSFLAYRAAVEAWLDRVSATVPLWATAMDRAAAYIDELRATADE